MIDVYGGTMTAFIGNDVGSQTKIINQLNLHGAATFNVNAGTVTGTSLSQQTVEITNLSRAPGSRFAFAGTNNFGNTTVGNYGAVIIRNTGLIGGTMAPAANNDGILGSWATVGNDWATIDANNVVKAYTGYATALGTATTASNVRITASAAVSAGGQTINSLIAQGTVTIGASDTLTVDTGAIGNVNAQSLTFSGGKLTANSGEIGLFANGAAMTINSQITGALTVGLSGAQTIGFTNAANNFTGGVAINSIFGGNIELLGPVTLATAVTGTDDRSVTLSGVISGAGSLTKVQNSGGGNKRFNLVLSGTQPNTYTGGTYANANRILANKTGALGPGPVYVTGGDSVELGAAMALQNPGYISNGHIAFNSPNATSGYATTVRAWRTSNSARTPSSPI